MLLENQSSMEEIDEEWIELLLTAKNMGLTLQEIRAFFEGNQQGQVMG